jgi:SpoVK/Ycf46/Vps4 family AAA+-type ATPase
MEYSQEIKQLKEALSFTPNNIALRLLLTQKLLAEHFIDEVINESQEILKMDKSNLAAKELLAEAFYKQEKYSAVIMIVEEIQDDFSLPFKLRLFYTKALVKDGNIAAAQEQYSKILAMTPGFSDKELDDALRVKMGDIFEELEMEDAGFIEKSDVTFKDVGGLDNVKREINLKIIKPLENPEIYKKFGKKVGGGILLYGPPGCGKTFLAKATAGEINANFINVTISDILDMYMGKSEQNLAETFEIARVHKPTVMFFDEVDALGANRHDMRSNQGRHVINTFLAELDGMESDNEGLLIIGATNTPWALDSAFRRPGRFDRIIFVPPPDEEARKMIFELSLEGKPIQNIDYKKLASLTKKYSGADIKAVVDIATESKLEIALETGEIEAINTKDLVKAIKLHKPTTADWFNTAKNYALYSNQSGLYDDILKYL